MESESVSGEVETREYETILLENSTPLLENIDKIKTEAESDTATKLLTSLMNCERVLNVDGNDEPYIYVEAKEDMDDILAVEQELKTEMETEEHEVCLDSNQEDTNIQEESLAVPSSSRGPVKRSASDFRKAKRKLSELPGGVRTIRNRCVICNKVFADSQALVLHQFSTAHWTDIF